MQTNEKFKHQRGQGRHRIRWDSRGNQQRETIVKANDWSKWTNGYWSTAKSISRTSKQEGQDFIRGIQKVGFYDSVYNEGIWETKLR